MLSLLEVIKRTTEYFGKHGVESPRLNAELIAAHALGLNRMQLYVQFERSLADPELEAIRALVRRRGLREPLAYVLGTAAFRDLILAVDKRVLVPRPETEQLVDLVRDTLNEPPGALLDLGTGSGALALALAKIYATARVVAVEASEDALQLARANAERSGLAARVEFRLSDWWAALAPEESFELIVANPPYLSEAEWQTAAPEVRDHEPKSALVAADDGVADLLRILAGARAHLAPGGWLFLETGIDQHARLLSAAAGAGFVETKSAQDWHQRDRFIAARAPGA